MTIGNFLFKIFFAVAAVMSLASCGGEHLVSDAAERQSLESDYAVRKAGLQPGVLPDLDKLDMSVAEREAMMFLYAYMPMSDVVDYTPQFFLKNIRTSFEARRVMPWGASVPEREFRHFVLPVRVNNEDIDSARWIFYEELRPRVGHLSMRDAVLEVNHWCHEKVVYTPSDPRTSSPLATMRTAYGRCGEESTFTVAALRSVGIPARQVYTPRWAHTDNNHAWVEAWVDGEWMFLGACEPEPVLNLGWFNVPASRSMLMHTKVFGRYMGPEEIMRRTPLFTEINIIDNYAPSSRVDVEVQNPDGTPASGAKVQFRLYNYAEYYTIATKQADAGGRTFLSAGHGDLVVWASAGGRYGFRKVSFGCDNAVTITLNHTIADDYALEFDLIPPDEGADIPLVTDCQRTENNLRLAVEDSIRTAYTATFYTDEKARLFAAQYGYDGEYASLVTEYLVASRGNHPTLTSFLVEMADANRRDIAVAMLGTLLQKDLRDVTIEVLHDNIQPVPEGYAADIYTDYVRCPRVEFELLTPYKAFFVRHIDADSAAAYRSDAQRLVAFVKSSVRVELECNLGGAPISPAGVWRAGVADPRSRDIYFVSLARSLDIPARIDPVTGKVQLMDGGTPRDVDFEVTCQTSSPTGTLRAEYAPTPLLDDPKYYNHFTISRIMPDGTLSLLAYDEGESGMEQGTSWSNLLRQGTPLDTGHYLLVTGNRLANGGVLSSARAFTIRQGEISEVDLVIRHSESDVEVIGEFDSESRYMPTDAGGSRSVLATTGRGYFVVAILGVNQEPTNHALRDIAAVAPEFEAWGRQMLLLFQSEDDFRKYNAGEFGAPLPSNITYGIDIDHSIERNITAAMKLRRHNLPVFIIADTFNRIVFCSQGYTINLGEQMMNTIRRL